MYIWILVFLGSLIALLIAAKFFTTAAEKIGLQLGFSPFIIGVFIVGIGTSLPELISGFISVGKGTSEIVVGNILGANISNIFLISGLAALIAKKRIDLGSQYILIDLHFMLGSAFLLGLVIIDGSIVLGESIFLLVAFIIYTVYIIKSGQKAEIIAEDIIEEIGAAPKKNDTPKNILILVACGVGIYFGADYTVLSIEKLAGMMGIPAAIISITALSLGTTLPELSVNISAIRQGKAEMAIGNVLGSCVFNALAVSGAAGLVGTISVPSTLLYFSLPVLIIASLFFYLLTLDKKISPFEGALFVVFYLFFIYKIATGVT